MCVACDLLTGLDLDELAPLAPGGALALHLPDGNAGLGLVDAGALHLKRLPTQGSNRHWAPASVEEGVAATFRAAREAYEGYRRAAADGRVSGDLRWQLSLPSPFTWLSRTVPPEQVASLLQPLQQQVTAEMLSLTEQIPGRDIALQWDLAAETALWESRGRDLSAGRQLAGAVLEGLVALGACVPAEAQLGYHLCRRDGTGATAPDPLDAAQLSHLAGALLASVERNIDFLHVPAARVDASAEWFAPYARLQAWPDTELHVGVAWADEDTAAVTARIEATREALQRFAPAPACGERPVAARLALEAALETLAAA